jgi:uncharacterized membrane protein YdjX (TVP38/TMEM64 family)
MTRSLVRMISVVGFIPDIFMSLFIGYNLEKNPTLAENQHLFTIFTIIPIFVLIASLGFKKSISKL